MNWLPQTLSNAEMMSLCRRTLDTNEVALARNERRRQLPQELLEGIRHRVDAEQLELQICRQVSLISVVEASTWYDVRSPLINVLQMVSTADLGAEA